MCDWLLQDGKHRFFIMLAHWHPFRVYFRHSRKVCSHP